MKCLYDSVLFYCRIYINKDFHARDNIMTEHQSRIVLEICFIYMYNGNKINIIETFQHLHS